MLRKQKRQKLEEVNNTFFCPKCGQNVETTPLRGTTETNSPVGYLQVVSAVANCPICGKKVTNRTLTDFNAVALTMAAIAEWRKQNPDGTKKQCRRRLGLKEEVVHALWEPEEGLEYHVMTPEEIEAHWLKKQG